MNKFTKSSGVLLTSKEKLENKKQHVSEKNQKREKTKDKFKYIYTPKSREKKTSKYTLTTEQESKA